MWLPENHRSAASHDAIKLGTGMISVLASLVLGLLTAGIKNSFDTTDGQIRTFAANLILLDETLRDYGPDATNARKLLHDYTARAIEDQWPQEAGQRVRMEDTGSGRLLHDARPGHRRSAGERSVPSGSAWQCACSDGWYPANALAADRACRSSMQPVFLVILIAWIVLIFVSFGYNAPLNATVVSAFVICSIALAACLFIITEMDTPFDGLIVISSHAMRDALAHMSQ